ncbi:hypothetical protein D3C76_1594610 [compost metagenome]
MYDWETSAYTIDLPAGTATIKVGGSVFEVTPERMKAVASNIELVGSVTVEGTLSTTGDITSAGKVIDVGGNTPNHKH